MTDALPPLFALLLLLSAGAYSRAAEEAGPAAPDWVLPGTGPVSRRYPRLSNYFHRSLPEGHCARREERLAQWSLLILNPHDVEAEGLSLDRIRAVNPRVRILAWIPFGQEPGRWSAFGRGVPPEGPGDWYLRKPDGELFVAPWGGHFMNPWADGMAWPDYVVDFAAEHWLQPGGYDGVLLDCLWEAMWMDADLDGNGASDGTDRARWQAGGLHLVKALRERRPDALILGNGGVPWSEGCPYWPYANGNMHENALGDEFGSPGWQALWDGYMTCMNAPGPLERIHLVAVDVRAQGRSQEQAERLTELTEEDGRRMRLGLGTTLLHEGYFGFDRGDCLHGQLWWFSEYAADLGAALGPCERDTWAEGTLSRRFENGLVVVNPTQQATLVVPGDPLVDASSGEAGDMFMIPAGDARILLRR